MASFCISWPLFSSFGRSRVLCDIEEEEEQNIRWPEGNKPGLYNYLFIQDLFFPLLVVEYIHAGSSPGGKTMVNIRMAFFLFLLSSFGSVSGIVWEEERRE